MSKGEGRNEGGRGKERRGTRRNGTFLSQESTKEPISDVNASWIKLAGGTASNGCVCEKREWLIAIINDISHA